VFTVRYALSAYLKQTYFVFKGLKSEEIRDTLHANVRDFLP
jgi:hypothetical protein